MKKVTVVCYERGDWYWHNLNVDEAETLREAVAKLGVTDFLSLDVDIDDSEALRDGMSVPIRILQ